jgi:hypothetical protein|tara:strand:+ start:385 stop:606 length:222 start_codon:yes stop_codon:yes gene_type:complete
MSIDPADYWMTPDEERRLEDKLTTDNYRGLIKEELNSSASMTREQYDKLKASGMMWEMHPFFTGDYHSDMQNH